MVLMKNVGRKLAAQTAAAAAGRVRLFSAVVNSEWVRSSGQKLRILDCDQPGAFQRAHIPDATPFAAATTGLKDPNSTGAVTELQFRHVLEQLEIEDDATLVFYDDHLSLNATRAWWVFLQYGFPKDKLKVLDGGWKQWVADTGLVSTHAPGASSESRPLWSPSTTTDVLVGLDAVNDALLSGDAQFADARSIGEYTGASANGNLRAGRVPGAVHFEWLAGVDFAQNGKFKSKAELEALVTGELGLRKDNPVLAYCQRGIRAAHSAFVLQEVLGFEDVKIYENSMLEYLNRQDTAVTK